MACLRSSSERFLGLPVHYFFAEIRDRPKGSSLGGDYLIGRLRCRISWRICPYDPEFRTFCCGAANLMQYLSSWSGRIEARIGLRMMPTFPRSPLSFRTASFPQYGCKAGYLSGAFLGDRRLKPAPDIRRPPSSLHPPFVHFVVATVVRSESGLRTRSCTAMRWNTPPTPGALARVRVVVSRSVIT
jgi:hypothetical protein